MPRPTPSVPADLQELSGRFEDWRRTRRGKLPIPEPLWTTAAELARSRGVCQTAQVLRLEYKTLEQLMDGGAGGKRPSSTHQKAGCSITRRRSSSTCAVKRLKLERLAGA
jgi:hypothetical protein